MRLKNKKTGEIGWLYCDHISAPKKITVFSEERNLSSKHWDYASLAELNEEWCDVPEEPKGIQCIYYVNHFDAAKLDGVIVGFETKEEAELAVRKLKAWKRLKDKGFRFNRWTIPEEPKTPHIKLVIEAEMDVPDSPYDLDLLLGGEE